MQHEVHRLSLDAALDIDLGKLVPCARAVAHVGVEGKVLVVQFIGMDGHGVDIGIAVADTMCPAVEEQSGIAAHLTAEVTEVYLFLLQVALHDTIGTHVHIEVEPRHGLFQAFNVYPALIHLTLYLLGRILEILYQLSDMAGRIQVSVIGLVLDSDAGHVGRAVNLGMGIIGDKQSAVQLPVDVVEREVSVPTTCAQVDVALGMEARRAVAYSVIHAQTVQVHIAQVTVSREYVMVVADGAMGIGVEVIALATTCSIHIGIAPTQVSSSPNVAIARAVIAHIAQVDGSIGPSRAAVGEVEAVATGVDACREVLDIIIGQERLDGEVVESGIHIVVLVAHVIVTVATHRATACRDAQVAGYPSAAFLIDFSAHLHGREFHAIQSEHLVEGARVAQVHLGVKVGLHAVHIGGIVDGTLALDAAQAGHVGIQRMDVEALVVAAGFCLEAHRLVVREVLECLAGIRHQFFHLVEVDFAVGVDVSLAVGLAVEHILVHMGIHLDVAALGLEFHVIEVQTVLVLGNSTAGVLDLQAAALLAREVLDGHLEVVAIILKIVDGGIHVLDFDMVRIQRGAGFVGFLPCLGVFALAVRQAHLVGLDFPGFVVTLVLIGILGRRVVLAVLLGVLLAGILVVHVSLVHIEAAHVNGLFAGIDFDILGLGMAHLGIKFIDSGLHIHLKVHIVGCDFLGIDFPGFAGLLIGLRFLLLGLRAHLGFTTLE